ncbi:TRAF-like family protein [Corchorus olitorius]|uniref:TRAF-like family protein n=1 Tax=Corchorus olitorius TaxID=93759 RepID=A0A1R3IIM2_9ROSI|nr:TRAF-like family protein [Corchorus olitorius]
MEKRRTSPLHIRNRVTSKILSKTGLDTYESTVFEACGYKWMLILYPEGDKQRNGDGHISLYLRLEDIQNLEPGWEVDALLTFFVFNKDQFMSIQGGRSNRFNAIQKEWGFSKLLPLTEFNDDISKGYLIGNAWFSISDKAWGFPYFIKLPDLESKDGHGLIVNDSAVVEAEITPMSMTKDLSQPNC